MNVELNYVVLLAASLVGMAVGFIWYSPTLFGKPWMRLMGFTADSMKKAQKKMGLWYFVSFILTVITAYVLYHVIALSLNFFEYSNVQTGLMTGFWMWLGFVMPVQLTGLIFGKEHGGKAWQLFVINTGYQLTSLLLMGLTFGILG